MKDNVRKDHFVEQHDAQMRDMAIAIMQSRKITEEQIAQVIGWLVLNMHTVKQSMWTRDDFEKAVENAVLNKQRLEEAVNKVLARKAWRWAVALAGAFLVLVAILILLLFGVDPSRFIHIHN